MPSAFCTAPSAFSLFGLDGGFVPPRIIPIAGDGAFIQPGQAVDLVVEVEGLQRAPKGSGVNFRIVAGSGGFAPNGAAGVFAPIDFRTNQARATLRETPGFGDFLGTRGEPSPLTEAQVTSILSRMSDSEERPQVAIALRKGDMVKIKSGAFDGFDGAIDEVNPDKGTVKVIVTIFGRPTPVELEYWEVESV